MLTRTNRNPQSISVTPDRRVAPPIESIDWWWHPSRPGVSGGPAWFERKLDEVDSELAVTWNAYKGQYQLWAKKPSMSHRLCWGWTYLFPVSTKALYESDGALVLARLFEASDKRWGSAREYFNAIVREQEKAREQAEKSALDDLLHRAGEVYDERLATRAFISRS